MTEANDIKKIQLREAKLKKKRLRVIGETTAFEKLILKKKKAKKLISTCGQQKYFQTYVEYIHHTWP